MRIVAWGLARSYVCTAWALLHDQEVLHCVAAWLDAPGLRRWAAPRLGQQPASDDLAPADHE